MVQTTTSHLANRKRSPQKAQISASELKTCIIYSPNRHNIQKLEREQAQLLHSLRDPLGVLDPSPSSAASPPWRNKKEIREIVRSKSRSEKYGQQSVETKAGNEKIEMNMEISGELKMS